MVRSALGIKTTSEVLKDIDHGIIGKCVYPVQKFLEWHDCATAARHQVYGMPYCDTHVHTMRRLQRAKR